MCVRGRWGGGAMQLEFTHYQPNEAMTDRTLSLRLICYLNHSPLLRGEEERRCHIVMRISAVHFNCFNSSRSIDPRRAGRPFQSQILLTIQRLLNDDDDAGKLHGVGADEAFISSDLSRSCDICWAIVRRSI